MFKKRLFKQCLIRCLCVIAAISLASCRDGNTNSQRAAGSTRAESGAGDGGKRKPAPGTGNVQGRVLFNSKPIENIEVKLCEKFSRSLGGCDGQIYTARTDANGKYVIADVEPKVYEGLLARMFETDSYILAAEGAGGFSSTTFKVTPDKTLYIPSTNLFKNDLKVLNPQAGEKTSAQNLQFKWDAYPDAVYYRFSIQPEEPGGDSPYVNERVEATSFAIDKPLEKGTYRWQVTAYNSSDQKLAESSNDIKFTIN